MSTSWPVALAILVASISILASDYFQLKYMATLPAWAGGAAFLAAVLSGSVLSVALVQQITGLAMRPIRKRRYEAAKAAHVEA